MRHADVLRVDLGVQSSSHNPVLNPGTCQRHLLGGSSGHFRVANGDILMYAESDLPGLT